MVVLHRTLVVRPLLALFVVFLLATGTSAQEAKFRPIGGGVEGEYIVVLRDAPPTKTAAIAAELSGRHHAVVRQIWTNAIRGFWARMPESAAKAMSSDPRVRFIQQNVTMLPSGSRDVGPGAVPLNRNGQPNPVDATTPFPYNTFPSELGANPLWHLRRLSHRLHDSGTEYGYVSDGGNVNIYVVDGGVLRFHQEFIETNTSSLANALDRANPLLHNRVAEVSGSKIVPAPDGQFNDGDGYPSSAPWMRTRNPAGTTCPTPPCQQTCVPPPIGAPSLTRTDETVAGYNPTIWFTDPFISHGTACGSVAGGRNVGVAKEATIIPVKVIGCDFERTGTEAELISAFEWVLTEVRAKSPRVASVVTMSTYRAVSTCAPYELGRCKLGNVIGLPHATALEETIREVIDDGVPVVASANNNARDACNETPARLSRSGGIANLGDGRGGVITVAGWAKTADERWTQEVTALGVEPGSNWGPCIDLWAPAERIAVADARSWYAYRTTLSSGTSFSAPMVAGMIARLFSEDGTLRSDLNDVTKRSNVAERIWDRLKDSATPFEKPALLSEIEFPPPTPPAVQSADDALGAAILEASPRRLAYIGAFSFKTQPQPVQLTDAEKFLTAEPVGAAVTSYQWYREQDSTTSVMIPGATSSTLCVRSNNPPPPCQGPSTNTRYWVRATRADPDPQNAGSFVYADSASATVVFDRPIILQHPASTWVRRGSTVTLTTEVLVPKDTTATYKWFMKPDPTPAHVLGESSSYSVSSATETRTYYVVVTVNGQSVTSDSAVVRVIGAESEKPQNVKITYDPLFAREYQLPDFKVNVAADGAGLKYQWYAGARLDVSKPIYIDAEHFETQNKISLVAGQYSSLWVRVSNEAGPANSDQITPPVYCDRFNIDVSTDWNRTVTTGGVSVMSARVVPTTNPTSGSYTYKWYKDGGQQLIEDTLLSGPVVRVLNPTTETEYRAVITSSACPTPLASKVIRLHPGGCPSSIPNDIPETKLLYSGNALRILLNANVQGYQWWSGNGDIGAPFQSKDCGLAPCNEATLLADPTAPPLPSQVWLRVHTCTAPDFNAVWEDTNLINIGVTTCGQSGFSLATAPRNVGVSTTFDLLAPEAPAGSIYKWYSGLVPNDVLLGQTSVPSFTVTDGVAESTFFSVVIEGTSCNPTPVRSSYHHVNPCGSPRRRAVAHSAPLSGTSDSEVVNPGDPVILDVEEPEADVTYVWYSDNPAEADPGSGTSVTVYPTMRTTYWAIGTRLCPSGPLTAETYRVTIDVICYPTLTLDGPHDTSAPLVNGSASITVSVTPSGRGPFTYAWRVVGTTAIVSTTASYTWNATAAGQKQVFVEVFDSCGGTETRTVTLSATSCPVPTAFPWGGGSIYVGGEGKHAGVNVDPPGNYTYQWYRGDGTPLGETTTIAEKILTTYDLDSYYVKVTSSCGAFVVSKKIYLYIDGECLMPPLSVGQSATWIPSGPGQSVTFTATCDFSNIDLQWYEGQSGDTRKPINSDVGHPNQLTITGDVSTYWVRASRNCGAHVDSSTVTFTKGICKPNLITAQPASIDVAYGATDATLTVGAADAGSKLFYWHKAEDLSNGSSVATGQFYTLPPVTESGRYVAKVRDQTCSSTHAATSAVATVRVASCPSITPPLWQTEVWADRDSSAALDATAFGAVSYQWYSGEVGDTRAPIITGTQAAYVTQPVTEDAMYWVRIHGSGCIVDSPTITVKVCDPPEFGPSFQTNRNISSGQTVRFSAGATGTNLSYEWFEGEVGDTSMPVGRNIDVLQRNPFQTTDYWLRITGHCSTSRVLISSQITASVCPVLTPPTATKMTVMSGTSTTLSIAATGTRLMYQWFKGPSGDRSQPIAGATGKDLPISIAQATTFWCEVTSAGCSRFSDDITISVCALPTLSIFGRDKVNKSEFQVLSLVGLPGDVNREINWYQGESGNTSTPITNQTNLGISPLVTTKYWARLTLTDTGCYADANSLEVKVCIPQITAQPQPTMINTGGIASMTVGIDLADPIQYPGIGYQWYVGQSGDLSNPISGQTSKTLTASPTANTSYWVRVTGCAPYAVNSAAALVTICEPPSIFRQPSSMNVAANVSRSIDVGASGSNLTYQWYKGVSGDTSMPLAGKTDSSITVSITETTDYWVRVSGSCGTPLNSNTAKISIPPTISTQPAGGGVVMTGSVRTMTLVAAGTQLSYEWHKVVGVSDTVIAGENTTSYTTPGITTDVTYYCRVYSGANFRDSALVVFTVCQLPVIGFSGYNAQVTSGFFQNLSVTGVPTDTPYEYAWFRGASGDVTNPLSGQAAIGVSPTVTTSYWVRVTATETGCSVNSTTATINVCRPTITTQPVASTTIDKIANPSAFAALTVAANVTPVTYQWYIGQPGTTTSPVPGATSSTYNASPSSTTTYWVRVTGNCGISQDSTAATVIVCQIPQITQHPSNTTSTANSTRTLSVTATGTQLAYAWFVGTSGTTTTPIGGNSSTVNVTPSVTTDYWVRVTGLCGTANSNTAKISIAPAISVSPAGGPITSGTTRTLTVTASGTQLLYQWYRRSGVVDTIISGATSASYTTTPITADTTFFARVHSGAASTESAEATLTVCLPRTIGVSGWTSVSGSPVTLSVTNASPGDETYEWYRGAAGNTSALIGGSTTVSVSPLETTQYWLRTKRPGCDADSAAVTVTICIPKITTQPVGGMIASGTSKTLSVAATGTPTMTYQWYIGASGNMASPIAGATAASYTTPNLTTATTYWVRITGPQQSCGTHTINSAEAAVTVCQPPVITQQPTPKSANWNQSTTLQVTATGDGLNYQWYQGTAGVTTTPVGSNSRTLTVTPGSTKWYWVRVSGTCGSVDSVAALVSIFPVITTQPVDAPLCGLGSSVTYSIAASGTQLTYQWFRQYSSQPVAVGTTATVSIPIAQVPAFVYCTVTSGNASVTSNIIELTTTSPKPTVFSITKSPMSGGRYVLQSNVSSADRPLVLWKWYEGPVGNVAASTVLYEAGFNEGIIVTPASLPKSYWVRVSYQDTGCASDVGVSVP